MVRVYVVHVLAFKTTSCGVYVSVAAQKETNPLQPLPTSIEMPLLYARVAKYTWGKLFQTTLCKECHISVPKNSAI